MSIESNTNLKPSNGKIEFKYVVKCIQDTDNTNFNENKIIIKKTKLEDDVVLSNTSGRVSPAFSITSTELSSEASLSDSISPPAPAPMEPLPKLQISLGKLLERECIICKDKMHQDKLYEHASAHFYENPKCRFCERIFTNPSCFVTHTSSHTVAQFYCINCDKSFRQAIVYKKHKKDCGTQRIQPIKITIPKKDVQPAASAPVQLETEINGINENSLGITENLPESTQTETAATIANVVDSLSLEPSKDLSSCGVYKIKMKHGTVQQQQQATNSQKENLTINTNTKRKSLLAFDELNKEQSLSKPLNANNLNIKDDLDSSNASMSSQSSNSALLSSVSQSNSDSKNRLLKQPLTPNKKSTFECPECDKKFVSYFGLFQHFDTHPNLAVTCSQCEIAFSNHRALIAHNNSVHKNDEAQTATETANSQSSNDNNDDKQKSDEIDASSTSPTAPQLDDDTTKSSSDMETADTQTSVQNDKKKSKSLNDDVTVNGTNNTRNIRINTPKITTILTTQTTSGMHHILANRVGFADLSFVDFSCLNFPRIAQYYCELWPRKSALNSPLHKYTCPKCQYAFPCLASLYLHENNLLTSTPVNNKTKQHSCELFMPSQATTTTSTSTATMNTVNSYQAYQCIYTTLDNIIKQIEIENTNRIVNDVQQKQQQETQTTMTGDTEVDGLEKELFLKTLSLVKTDELNKYKSRNDFKMTMRHTLLGINTQYTTDMDKWRLSHTNETHRQINMSKVSLKPNVNLNRPLLIRTKKLKRTRTQQSSLFMYSNMNEISSVIAANKVELEPPKLVPHHQPATQQPQKQKPSLKRATSLQGTFSMTSGNFSGSNSKIYNHTSNNENNNMKKRKSNDISENVIYNLDESFGDSNEKVKVSSLKKHKKKTLEKQSSNENENGNTSFDNSDIVASIVPLKLPKLYKAPLAIDTNEEKLKKPKTLPQLKSPNIKIEMPKLQPIIQHQQSQLSPNTPMCMPKLKPINKEPKLKNKIQMFTSIHKHKTKSHTTEPRQSSKLNENFFKLIKENENILLRCKSCSKIFKGQSEFLQHVLIYHSKMLKEKLNRRDRENTKQQSFKKINS